MESPQLFRKSKKERMDLERERKVKFGEVNEG